MRSGKLKAALDGFRDVPVADVVDRRHAPVLQALMLFIVVSLPANWCYHLLLVNSPTRRDVTVDVLADTLVWAVSLAGFVLIRRGRLRQAVIGLVAAMLVNLTVVYLFVGLTRGLLDQTLPVLTIVLGGLVLGRRPLWTLYALLIGVFAVGGVSDILTLQRHHYPRPWLGAANLPSLILSYFVISLVLDRCVAAIRTSLGESRRMGGALAAANQALREEMAARERAQEGLVHAQKMETVGRLASGVAHDFNNVLAVIAGYAEQAQASDDPGQLRQAVQGIAAATRRGTAVSRKLLSFSRRDSVRPEVFEIGEALREIGPMLRQLLGAAVALRVEAPPRPLHLRADRGQFELALLNIAANARDAMDGQGGLRVLACAGARGGIDGVEVRLEDSGRGMPDHILQRIFEPFFTTKPAGSGTGLGLAVVRDVVHAAGGDVAVESREGQGTAFRLWFPCAAGELRGPARRRAVRVLLVEDDHELRELLLAALDDAGCVALATDNAFDAGRLLAEAGGSLEVVVSDCRMPGNEDGRLRWLEDSGLPVLLISASGEAEARRLRALGLEVECLPKPFPPTLLVERVQAAAERRAATLSAA
ncbi:ATP-binding protein [Fulvimonas sp. R45]|uniref:ATP-binding protein n=1 Tax=Fulvimonas sp. R45 TaxID=3045937 RepID=UPI00265EE971|nr:ATP-binding protein [Fulvimonas sp. R45]MDO1530584.1 ATP-binding protein [Fulvimonas sp. R45]